MAEVDEHPDAVHLGDDLATEVGEPAQRRLVRGGVGPRDVVVVGEGQVADTEAVEHAQRAERLVDLVAALGTHQAGDLALLPCLLDVLHRGGEGQLVGVPL